MNQKSPAGCHRPILAPTGPSPVPITLAEPAWRPADNVQSLTRRRGSVFEHYWTIQGSGGETTLLPATATVVAAAEPSSGGGSE